MDKNLPASAGGMGSVPGLGRFYMPRGVVKKILKNKKNKGKIWGTGSWVCSYPITGPPGKSLLFLVGKLR